MAICAIIISTSVRSPFHISEFCGYFSISHGKNINAAQVPWLTVAHLAINPEHCGPASADDHFLGLELCVGIADEPTAPEFATAAFPSMRRPSGAGDVSSNTVSSVINAANPSASCRLNTSLNLSMVVRVNFSCDCRFCLDIMEISLGEHRFPNRKMEQITNKT